MCLKPKLSIIIPCFNDVQFIEQAVSSALNQTYPNIEVIVVDDGSNEETKKVLKKIAPTITKLITQQNKGQSTARNVGINNAKGAIIFVLDSDDFIEQTLCEKAVKILSNKDVKIVTCEANLLFSNGTSRIFKPNGGDISKFILVNEAIGTSFFRRSDWSSVGGYDETMNKGFEDWEFFIRLLAKGGHAIVIEEPLYNYRKRNSSTSPKANKIKYDLLRYIYFKHIDIYKQYFEDFTNYLLCRVEREEKEKNKKTMSIEYQIGLYVLKPIRLIKTILKW